LPGQRLWHGQPIDLAVNGRPWQVFRPFLVTPGGRCIDISNIISNAYEQNNRQIGRRRLCHFLPIYCGRLDVTSYPRKPCDASRRCGVLAGFGPFPVDSGPKSGRLDAVMSASEGGKRRRGRRPMGLAGTSPGGPFRDDFARPRGGGGSRRRSSSRGQLARHLGQDLLGRSGGSAGLIKPLQSSPNCLELPRRTVLSVHSG
jgi:hypothetical protein